MIAVTGATGHIGRAVAENLLDAGSEVTAIVRDPARAADLRGRGARLVKADLNDSAAIASAFEGADSAFLMIPPEGGGDDLLEDTRKFAESLAEATRKSNIPYVVLLSSVGAQHAEGTGPIRGLHVAEKLISAAARNSLIVRASFFFENWLQGSAKAREGGVLQDFVPSGARVPMIATSDIAKAVSEALLKPTHGKTVQEITGPQDYTPEDIAAALSARLGRTVTYQGGPLSSASEIYQQQGLSKNTADLYTEMMEAIKSGRATFTITPKRFETTAEEFFAQAL